MFQKEKIDEHKQFYFIVDEVIFNKKKHKELKYEEKVMKTTKRTYDFFINKIKYSEVIGCEDSVSKTKKMCFAIDENIDLSQIKNIKNEILTIIVVTKHKKIFAFTCFFSKHIEKMIKILKEDILVDTFKIYIEKR